MFSRKFDYAYYNIRMQSIMASAVVYSLLDDLTYSFYKSPISRLWIQFNPRVSLTLKGLGG